MEEKFVEGLSTTTRADVANKAVDVLLETKDEDLFALPASTLKSEDRNAVVKQGIAQLAGRSLVGQKIHRVSAAMAVVILKIVKVSAACSRTHLE